VKDLSKMLVQGTFPDQEADSQIYIEINHNSSLPEGGQSGVKVTQLKKGTPKKVSSSTIVSKLTKPDDVGNTDKDGIICFSDSDDNIEIEEGAKVKEEGAAGSKRIEREFNEETSKEAGDEGNSKRVRAE
jgi:hypothetical protein